MEIKSRNLAVDWIKGVMMFFIIITHSGTLSFVHHGYLGVNVFFVFAGYFMMRGFALKPTSSVKYTWSRVKQFFLPYILVFIFTCCLKYHGLTHFSSFDSFLEKYAQLFFGISLIEEAGPQIMVDHILWGSWFISSLLVSGFLLYSMLEFNRKLSTNILFPFIVILGFTVLYSQNPGVSSWSRVGGIGLPLLRGLSCMAGGALLYEVFNEYRPAFERRSLMINLASILSLILFIALMFSRETLDRYIIVTLPWIVLGGIIDSSWINACLKHINGGIFGIIGKHSLYVLLVQEPSILLVHWSNSNVLSHSLGNTSLFIMDVAVTLIASFLLYHACGMIRRRLNKK